MYVCVVYNPHTNLGLVELGQHIFNVHIYIYIQHMYNTTEVYIPS